MLYNVGIGARPYDDVEFLFEGKGPKVFPTFAVIGGMAGMGVMGQLEGINPVMILHGEQSITLHRELPPRANLTLAGRARRAVGQGRGRRRRDRDDGDATTRARSSRRRPASSRAARVGSAASAVRPRRTRTTRRRRSPTTSISDETRIEQAAIYRLSGDRNPLHIDPEFAKMGGFETPILHGLCTYGFVGRAILKALCGNDPANLKHFEARFADVVYPGDTITTKMWVDGKEAIVQAETQKGNIVLANAKAIVA